ncbi:MAG: GNAT family N-acetyltransferase [Rhodomicrobiaceae bacterium]
MTGIAQSLTPEILRAPIETRRLILRLPAVDDIPAISRLINDPVIAHATGTIRYPYPPSSAWSWIAGIGKIGRKGAFHMPYLLTLRSNPRLFAGAAGVSIHPARPPEIGYWLGRDFRRKGYASEAARALISLVFEKSDADAVGAGARTVNPASQHVLRSAGMRRVGVGRIRSLQLGRYVPVILFRIERKDWEQRRTRRH